MRWHGLGLGEGQGLGEGLRGLEQRGRLKGLRLERVRLSQGRLLEM